MILGADSVPAAGEASPNLESELRFYSVWWIGAGLFLIVARAARRGANARDCACSARSSSSRGLSRLFAVLATDWPSTGQIVLMVIELVLAVVLALWQASVARPIRQT